MKQDTTRDASRPEPGAWRILIDRPARNRRRRIIIAAAGAKGGERRYYLTFCPQSMALRRNQCEYDLRRFNPSVAAAVESYCRRTLSAADLERMYT